MSRELQLRGSEPSFYRGEVFINLRFDYIRVSSSL